eukprot:Em0084g13a
MQTSAYGHFNDTHLQMADMQTLQLCTTLHTKCCGAVRGSYALPHRTKTTDLHDKAASIPNGRIHHLASTSPEAVRDGSPRRCSSAELPQMMKKSNLDPEVLAVRLLENKIIDESILEDVRSRTSVTEKVKTLSDAVTKLGKAACDDCCALIKNVELECPKHLLQVSDKGALRPGDQVTSFLSADLSSSKTAGRNYCNVHTIRWEGCLDDLLAHNEELQDHHGTLKTVRSIAPDEFIMNDYEDFRKSWKMWFSPSFYTHPNGYRMCLRVDAEDNGHLSVYAYLMKGVYDDSLPFPFRGTVTVQLINRDKPHQCDIVFDENIDPKHSMRVEEKERQIIGYGNSKFIPLHKLGSYLEHNSLKFRVMVKTKPIKDQQHCTTIISGKSETFESDHYKQHCLTIINGRAEVFKWEHCGLMICVPIDCLPSNISKCELLITAHLNTEMHLPSKSSLVSGVYNLTMVPNIQKLNTPLELSIEHCVSLMPGQESHLSFAVARGESATKFEYLEGGSFYVDPMTVFSWLSNLLLDADINCNGRVYYDDSRLKCRKVQLIITKDIELANKIVDMEIPFKEQFNLNVLFREPEIRLDIPSAIVGDGWRFIPSY